MYKSFSRPSLRASQLAIHSSARVGHSSPLHQRGTICLTPSARRRAATGNAELLASVAEVLAYHNMDMSHAPRFFRKAPPPVPPPTFMSEVLSYAPTLRVQLVLLSVSGLLWLLWLLWKRLLHHQLSGSPSPHSPPRAGSSKKHDAGYPPASHWKKSLSGAIWTKED